MGVEGPMDVSPPRGRPNGVRLRAVTFEKKGRIQMADGSDGFGVVDRRETKEEFMLAPRRKIEGQPAVVSVGRGLTINLGDYSSARVDEWITMPCTATPEEVEATRADLRREIEGHVEAERVRIKGTMAERVACVKQGLLKLDDFDPDTRSVIERQIGK